MSGYSHDDDYLTFSCGVDRRAERSGAGVGATGNDHELIARGRLQSVNG